MSALPELTELERILELGRGHLQSSVACEVSTGNQRFPVYRLTMGNPDPTLPAIGFFGGVHGLERIGTQVLLYFLRSLLTRLEWDKSLHHLLQDVRLVFMPLIAFLLWKISYLGWAFDYVESNFFGRHLLDFGGAYYSWSEAC